MSTVAKTQFISRLQMQAGGEGREVPLLALSELL